MVHLNSPKKNVFILCFLIKQHGERFFFSFWNNRVVSRKFIYIRKSIKNYLLEYFVFYPIIITNRNIRIIEIKDLLINPYIAVSNY